MSEHMSDQHSETGDFHDRAAQGADAMHPADGSARTGDASDEEIRNRAHEIYLGRGGSEGDPIVDWLAAEREVRGRFGATQSLDDPGSTDGSRDTGIGEEHQ